MPQSTEQVFFNFAVGLLPDQARVTLEHAATLTVLQYFRLLDVYHAQVQQEFKTPLERDKYRDEVRNSMKEAIDYAQDRRALPEAKQAKLNALVGMSNKYGCYIAPFGAMWLFSGYLIYPSILLTVSWGLLAPSLANKPKLGNLLEERYGPELAYGFNIRNRVNRATYVPQAGTASAPAPESGCRIS